MKTTKTEKFFMFTIAAVLLAATLQHFLYEWIPCNFVALFSPVNESVWEHLKLLLFPTVTAYIVGMFILAAEGDFKKNDFAAACLISVSVQLLAVMSGYYLLHSGFGIAVDVMWVDLVLMALAVAFGQLVAAHVYRRAHCVKACRIGSIVVLAMFVAGFCVLTFYAPPLPIFIEP